MYIILNNSSSKGIVWECIKCVMPIFSTTLFDTSYSLETKTDLIFFHPCPTRYQRVLLPTADSTPIIQDKNGAREKTTESVLNHPLIILEFMNCQSIKNKKAELHNIINMGIQASFLG